MAKISVHDMFPSKWLSSADLNNRELTVKIANPAISYERLKQMNGDGSEEKAVLHFHNPRGATPLKPMVLNKVNLTTLIVLFGDDDDDYPGKQIKIGVDMVPVGNEVKPGLRIRTWQPDEETEPAPKVTKSAPRSKTQPTPERQPDDDGQNDDDTLF
jgi:hypothetical protein